MPRKLIESFMSFSLRYTINELISTFKYLVSNKAIIAMKATTTNKKDRRIIPFSSLSLILLLALACFVERDCCCYCCRYCCCYCCCHCRCCCWCCCYVFSFIFKRKLEKNENQPYKYEKEKKKHSHTEPFLFLCDLFWFDNMAFWCWAGFFEQ